MNKDEEAVVRQQFPVGVFVLHPAKKDWKYLYSHKFQKLNDCIKRKLFPLPRIEEAIQRLENFKSTTAFDLSTGFYSIPIDEESQKLTTTVLLWGKHAY